MTIEVFDKTDPIKVQQGIRQKDNISPKLFTNTLEDIFKELNWEPMGLNINEERFSKLRFANDIGLLSNNLEDLQKMVVELKKTTEKTGHKINIGKTKIISNMEDITPILFGNGDHLDVEK